MSEIASGFGIRALLCGFCPVRGGSDEDGNFRLLFMVGDEDVDRSNDCDGFGVGTMVGDSVVIVTDDVSAVVFFGVGAQEKVPASSNTQESRFPSETSPMASLIIFHPGRGTPCAVNLVVKPSASIALYGLVAFILPSTLLFTKYSEFCCSFTVLIETPTISLCSLGNVAMFSPFKKKPKTSLKLVSDCCL